MDFLQRRWLADSVDNVKLAANVNVVPEEERNTTMEKFRGILNGLPPKQQRLLELAFFDGFSHSEIAAQTGDPLGTVKTRIRSALMSLRRAIQA